MFEGNEVEKDLGSVGKAIVDVDAKGMVKVEINASVPELQNCKAGAFVHVDVVEVLEMLAKKTDNGVDDTMVGMIKMALGRAA